MSATIALRGSDGKVRGYALVSGEDAERIGRHRWHLLRGGYAARTGPRPEREMVYMHREVLGLEHGDPRQADHVNGDRLDNRRENLRAVDRGRNARNVHARPGRSRFRGVCWNKQRGRWRAQASHEGRNHCLGDFDHEADAGRAVVGFWAEHDLVAAQQLAEAFSEALSPAEKAAQEAGARRRLVAAFTPESSSSTTPTGS